MIALIVDEPRLHAVGTPDAQGWWAEFRRIALAGRLRDIQASTDGCGEDRPMIPQLCAWCLSTPPRHDRCQPVSRITMVDGRPAIVLVPRGGMGNVGGSGNHQQRRERLWLSPHCIRQANRDEGQLW